MIKQQLPLNAGNTCPACLAQDITFKYLSERSVEPGDIFKCPLCGNSLKYSVSRHDIGGNRLLLHEVVTLESLSALKNAVAP